MAATGPRRKACGSTRSARMYSIANGRDLKEGLWRRYDNPGILHDYPGWRSETQRAARGRAGQAKGAPRLRAHLYPRHTGTDVPCVLSDAIVRFKHDPGTYKGAARRPSCSSKARRAQYVYARGDASGWCHLGNMRSVRMRF